MNETEHGDADNITEDAGASTESQRAEDDVSRETIEETRSGRVIQYRADGQLYEEEIPDPDSKEFDAWAQDKLAGWRSKRKEKGRDDPGIIEDAIERGVKAGLEYGKPKEPSVDDDPYLLMSKGQRKRYETLREEGTEDDRFQFLVDMGLENRKAHYIVDSENQALKRELKDMKTLQGAAQEMRMIAKIDSDFPDPDSDPVGAVEELKKPGGYFDWLDETGINGSTNRTYKLYLKDVGKEANTRKRKATGEAKPVPKASSDSTMKQISDAMGNVSGGGAAIGREADETEIRHFIQQNGIRLACDKYGQDASLKVFNKSRSVPDLKR